MGEQRAAPRPERWPYVAFVVLGVFAVVFLFRDSEFAAWLFAWLGNDIIWGVGTSLHPFVWITIWGGAMVSFRFYQRREHRHRDEKERLGRGVKVRTSDITPPYNPPPLVNPLVLLGPAILQHVFAWPALYLLLHERIALGFGVLAFGAFIILFVLLTTYEDFHHRLDFQYRDQSPGPPYEPDDDEEDDT